MSQPQPDIDRLVREVLAELGVGATAGLSSSADAPGATAGLSSSADARGATAGSSSSAGARGATGGLPTSAHEDLPTATGDAAGDGELVLSCRVVTMSDVAGRLASMRRLVVPAQAVVTPAVRDELRRRDISLIYAAAAPPAGSAIRLCLVTVGRHFDPAPLAAALAGQGVEVRSSALDCLLVATDRLVAEVVRPNTLGLLLTEHIAAALCLTNRHRGVRAVSGADAATAAAAVAAVGANLLVVDPAAGSFYQLRQIVGEFCHGGTRPCPEVFRERLG